MRLKFLKILGGRPTTCAARQTDENSPWKVQNVRAHSCAERFVRSIKDECLDRIIPIGERHFRRAVAEFVAHYHGERNHQGLNNRLIAGRPVSDMARGVRRRPRLGGLLNFYERAA